MPASGRAGREGHRGTRRLPPRDVPVDSVAATRKFGRLTPGLIRMR